MGLYRTVFDTLKHGVPHQIEVEDHMIHDQRDMDGDTLQRNGPKEARTILAMPRVHF
jgi:hypothetical protein